MPLKKIREQLKWLDPFTYVDLYVIPKVNPKNSETLNWIIYLISAFIFAWIIYTGLGILLGTQSPMMIVVSASMEPKYHRGDIVVLQGATPENLEGAEVQLQLPSLRGKEFASFAVPVYSSGSPQAIESINFNSGQQIAITQEGSVVVYWSSHMQEPIIHRVAAKLFANDGMYALTKGDSVFNSTIDQDCGLVLNGQPQKNCIELYPVPLEMLQGKVILQVPLLGCAKLWLLDDLGSLITKGRLPAEIMPGNIC